MSDPTSVLALPVVAGATGGILIALQSLLMLDAGLYRGRIGASIGLTDDQDLERKVRRHGNLAESSGLFVASLALLELLGGVTLLLPWLAGLYVAGRISHVVAFSSLTGSHAADGPQFFIVCRLFAAFGTFFSGLGVGGLLLWSVFSS